MVARGLAVFLCAGSLLAGCGDRPFGRSVGPATTSDERIAELRGTLARQPESIAALTGIGREYARQARWPEAAGAYREALIVDPGNRDALLGFSAATSALGDYGTALTHAERAVAARPDLPALTLAGVALSGQGRQAEARATFERALAERPRDLDVRNNLAITMALAGDPAAVPTARGVAFAPDADVRHRRNYLMVAAIAGQEAVVRGDAARLGITEAAMAEIFEIGRRARSSGVAAFGVAALL